MSREIDERIVQMKFENGQFERGVQTSINTMNSLKKSMNFEDSVKGFESLDRAARGVRMDGLGTAVETVKVKFGLLEVAALNVMNRISNAAINAGEQLVKSLTIDQITPGWTKYEEKTSSVQTIMAATASQFDDTAKQMEVVNSQLNKLNWFTDETSYNFVDMVNNIGKFTSNNIALDKSVTAMQGIANWAAISGANANEASRAMYNISQALSTGTVKLMDWKSIELANMATTEFKQTVIDIAEAQGTLLKVSDNLWTTLDKKTEVSVSKFNEGLSKGWFTNDVLMEALDKYGGAANKLNEIYETLEGNITTSSIVSYINDYTDAVVNARAESEKLGLSSEQSTEKITEAGKTVAQDFADEVGISLEEATEMLAQFDNETMQFGLKAFKAAQEAKTFSEAISSVKDAVSTGWMKSFELMFGDYNEAKEFWTNIANTLYDIFASSGDARNEMLADWADEGGRRYFTDTIYAGLAAILSILTPIKGAWEAVFGKMTGSRLAELTKKLNTFVISMIQSEEQMRTLLRVFRGLFSVLDIGKSVITDVIKGAFSVLQKILKSLNLDVGTFAANIGDALYSFRNWYKEQNVITTLFDKIGDAIVYVIAKAKEFVEAIENFAPVKAILDALDTAFDVSFQGIGALILAIGNVFQWLWDKFKAFKIPTSFDDVTNFFKEFAQAIRENLEEIGVSFEGLDAIVDKVRSNMEGSISKIGGVVGKTRDIIVSAFKFIEESTSGFDWSAILLAGYGVGALAILWKFTDALKGFAGALSNVTGVGKSAKGAMDSIKDYFKALKNNIDTNNLLKTSIAVTALAVAFALFSRLSWSQIGKGTVAILSLTAALGAIAVVIGLLNKRSIIKGNNPITKVILSLAGAVAIMAAGLKMVPTDGKLQDRILALIELLGAFAAVTTAMSIFSRPIEVGTKSMLTIAASIFILIQTMKSIGMEDITSIYAATPVIAALLVVLSAMSRLLVYTKKTTTVMGDTIFNTKQGGAFASIVALVIGLEVMISALQRLGRADPRVFIQGIVLMIPVLVLLTALFKAARHAGKEAASAGKMILYISLALNMIAPAIRSLSHIKLDELAKGGAVIAALSLLIFKPLIKASKDAGQYAGKAGLLILAISGALAVIQLVIKTLGKMDMVSLLKGTLAVSAVILAFSAVVRAMTVMSAEAAANASTVDAMKKILVIISVIGVILVALTLLDPSGALKVSIGVASLFAAIGVMMRMANKVELPDAKKLLALSGMISIMAIAIGLISKISDWRSALAISGGMSAILLSLTAMSAIIGDKGKNLEANIKAMIPIVKALGIVIGVFAVITGIASKLGASMRDILYITTAMSEILIALGVTAKIMKKSDAPSIYNTRAMTVWVAWVGGLTAIFAAIIAGFNKLDLSIDPLQLVAITTAMSQVLIALAAAGRLMNKVDFPKDMTDNLGVMVIFIGAIGVALAALAAIAGTYNWDLSGMIPFAASISVILLAVAAAVKIMDRVDFRLGAAQAIELGGLVIAIGAVLGYFSNMVNPITVIPLAAAMSAVIMALGVTANIIGGFKGSFVGAIKGIGVMLVIVAGLATLMGILGVIFNDPGTKQIMSTGADLMIQLGRGIGGFIGGILGGLLEGAVSGFPGICTTLSQGMQNLLPFFDALHQIPGGALELIGTLLGIVAAITGAQFISGLKLLPGVGQFLRLGSLTLVSDFTLFGAALKAFANEVKGIDVDAVKTAAEAAKMLGELEANIPPHDGLLQKFLGDKSLDEFGARMSKLGFGIRMFAIWVKDLDTDSISAATAAANSLMILEKNLPPVDGYLQKFLGQAKLDEFGSRLSKFGFAIKTFSIITTGISMENVETAKAAGDMLVKLEESLKPIGGVAGFFFGDSDLGKFSDRIKIFAQALVGFNTIMETGNIDLQQFLKAYQAGDLLAKLETNLVTNGGLKGLIEGDKSFGKFSANIKAYGDALSDFTGSLQYVNFEQIGTAIDYAERIVALDKLDESTANVLDSVKNLLYDVRETIFQNEAMFKDASAEMAKWIAVGFRDGTVTFGGVATTAAQNLANKIITIMNEAFKIHSPSVVMNEMGQWVVKGLADGISSETSAEEAASKKAQNIISAFETELAKFSTSEKSIDLEYQLWELTDGKNASDMEKANRQLQNEATKLADLAKTVGLRKSALKAVEEMTGKESAEYQSAYQDYLQAQIDMLNKQKEIDESQGVTIMDERESMKAYAAYMKENAEIYSFLGKSQKQLEDDAMMQAYGLDKEMLARKQTYERILEENRDAWLAAGKTDEELKAYASEKTGWTGAQTVTQAMIDTNQIIADNIESYAVSIEQSVSEAAAGAIKRGTGSGSSASAAAAMGGMELGNTLTDSISKAVGSSDSEELVAMQGQTMLGQVLDAWSDPLGTIMQKCSELGVDIDEETAQGVLAGNYTVSEAVGIVTNGGVDQLRNAAKEAVGLGKDFSDGYAKGIANDAAKAAIQSAAASLASYARQALASAQVSASPSKIAMELGNYFGEGYSIGIDSYAYDVGNSAEHLANSALSSLEYTKSLISDVLSVDTDFSPVITPVLNMDELKRDAQSIPGLLNHNNAINLRTARIQAGVIAARSPGMIQNGSITNPTVVNNYDMTQNNYSPKALNRVEIYRQTRNEFARLKGATQRK